MKLSIILMVVFTLNLSATGFDKFSLTEFTYKVLENNLIVISMKDNLQQNRITGTVTDEKGNPLPGVNVQVEGTTIGTITDANGKYSIDKPNDSVVLVFSFIGYNTEKVSASGKTTIEIKLTPDIKVLEEVVVVGYGSMRKKDLTGSVVRADIETFREQPNISIMQSLQGSVAGLNVGQVNEAGESPAFSIRGRTSISGLADPLIVLDGVIFRGSMIDINPNDIESVDVLKDASSAAIYGSQAANGVIIITSKSGGETGKPVINYTSYFSLQKPTQYYKPAGVEDFIKNIEQVDYLFSRTKESGYIEPLPGYSFVSRLKSPEERWAYENGISTNWYDLLTRENMSTQNHNLSIRNKTKFNNYFISMGYTDQVGYMLNEDFGKWNARINIDNTITDWLNIGIQSYLNISDFSGADAYVGNRYRLNPLVPVYNQYGEYVQITGGQYINPFLIAEADNLDKRLNLFGNIYANINIPFVKGLSYRVNLSNDYTASSNYFYAPYSDDFQGRGGKSEGIGYNLTSDNIVKYKNTFNNVHNVDVTLVYGMEKRKFNSTSAESVIFVNDVLGYNRLQAGSADQQFASSQAWQEASLYSMARLVYGFKEKYLFTGTIRRDGFSGFSTNNKFGLFPSLSFGWVISEESFLHDKFEWVDLFKFRLSYGSNGNRTIGRYQTLATTEAGFNYIAGNRTSLYTQSISTLASPDLKWEKTTGVNFGVDFGFLNQRLSGSFDYYNNNTTNLLYNVDIPGISRFTKFPDNLGKIHNNGLEFTMSSVNIKADDLKWTSSFTFSRNRNELKELLGFDNNDDGKEDDLISVGLFIDEPLNLVYDYRITGEMWQVEDYINKTIPLGFLPGYYKTTDLNNDGVISPDDRTIIGYKDPSYRFSINNEIKYKNWILRVFINSVQGGKNYYFAEDNVSDYNGFTMIFPAGLDVWAPENRNARYNFTGSGSLGGRRYEQRNFIRLQDVSLSYDFSPDFLEKLSIQNLKVSLSGKNLATFTKWNGWDPETGEDISFDGRPVMKSYTFGINFEF